MKAFEGQVQTLRDEKRDPVLPKHGTQGSDAENGSQESGAGNNPEKRFRRVT